MQAGGLGPITYPLLSDFNKKIARDYDVLVENAGVALRGLFIIDPKVQYPPLGSESQDFDPLGNINILLQIAMSKLNFNAVFA
jgi:peroxiredoxin